MKRRMKRRNLTFFLALKGGVLVGGAGTTHEPYHTLVLSANSNETGVRLTAGEDGTELVLVRPVNFLGTPGQIADIWHRSLASL